MKHKVLLYIASKVGMFSSLNISTNKIAEDLQTSQQTISRILINLENEGMIKRYSSQKGMKIKIDKTIEYKESARCLK